MKVLTLKNKFLILLFAIGFSISLFGMVKFFQASPPSKSSHLLTQINPPLVLIAVLLQLSGHYLRALNSTRLLKPIKTASSGLTFRSLSIGYLFNTLLPFRLGEIIRALLLARTLKVSRLAVFVTILVERVVDGLILFIFAVLLWLISTWQQMHFHPLLGTAMIWLLSVIVCLATGLLIIGSQNKMFLKAVGQLTQIFNSRLKNRLRFTVWSLIYAINLVISSLPKLSYIYSAFVMWLLYFGSAALLILGLSSAISPLNALITSVIAFLSVTIPSGPAYIGTFHLYFSTIVGDIITDPSILITLSIAIWCLLILPISSIGVVTLFKLRLSGRDLFFRLLSSKPNQDMTNLNKLERRSDISHELSQFLDSYFSGWDLSHVLNNQEISGNLKILKVYQGGSNAITTLIWHKGEKRIRKSITLAFYQKLYNQYEWLKLHKHLKHICHVKNFGQDSVSAWIDLKYYAGTISFFEYIHSNSIAQNKNMLKKIITFMQQHIYQNPKPVTSPEAINSYVKEKILGKVHSAARLSYNLQALVNYKTITVNGTAYLNAPQMVKKITSNKQLMRNLASYNQTAIHGDLSVENVLIQNHDFILLDPNDENYISDPLVDYAKLYQSLHSGYEFLIKRKVVKVKGSHIQFEVQTSTAYTQLFNYLHQLLAKKLKPLQMNRILFHEAVHYFRMLTYKAKADPITAPIYYAVAVRLLNQFYDETQNKKF